MIKRAFISVKRRKTKTIIFFLFLFIVANLVLSAISIKNATSETMRLARQSLGSEVTLAADMESLRSNFMKDGNNTPPEENGVYSSESSNENRKEQMKNMHDQIEKSNATIEDVKNIAKLSYVKDVKYTLTVTGEESSFTLYSSSNESNTETNRDNKGPGMMRPMNNSLQIEAINTFKLQDDYVDGKIKLVSGEAFDEDDEDTVIISYELATANDLDVGSTIIIKDSNENEHELKIIGIYQNEDTRGFNNNYNRIYINISTAERFMSEEEYNDGNYSINSAVFYLNDPENSDAFIKEAKKIVTDLEDRYLKLDIDTREYEQMVSSIEGVKKFSNTILIVVTVASVIVISLMVINSLKDRNYELGVLLSLGEKKSKIVMQFILELVIIALASFTLSIATSKIISQKLADTVMDNQTKIEENQNNSREGGRGNGFGPGNNRFNKNTNVIDEIDVDVNLKDVGLLYIVGYGIIFISMVIPSIKIVNSDPKDILSRKD